MTILDLSPKALFKGGLRTTNCYRFLRGLHEFMPDDCNEPDIVILSRQRQGGRSSNVSFSRDGESAMFLVEITFS